MPAPKGCKRRAMPRSAAPHYCNGCADVGGPRRQTKILRPRRGHYKVSGKRAYLRNQPNCNAIRMVGRAVRPHRRRSVLIGEGRIDLPGAVLSPRLVTSVTRGFVGNPRKPGGNWGDGGNWGGDGGNRVRGVPSVSRFSYPRFPLFFPFPPVPPHSPVSPFFIGDIPGASLCFSAGGGSGASPSNAGGNTPQHFLKEFLKENQQAKKSPRRSKAGAKEEAKEQEQKKKVTDGL